jgi:integrase
VAYARWKKDRDRRKVLVAGWRDPSVPGRWVEERRPNCTSRADALRYARQREEEADLIAKGLRSPVAPVDFGTMWDRWWKDVGQHRRGGSKEDFRRFLEKHLGALRQVILLPANAGDFAARIDELLNEKAATGALQAKSLNHLRDGVYGIFEHARNPKVKLWLHENPIQWVGRRRVPRRRYEILRRDQIHPLLAALPEPLRRGKGIASPWRWTAAIMLYTGVRPGEAFGLWKSDVDLGSGTLTIQRSWMQPLPKDDDWRPVLIVSELRPYLEAMLAASPGKLLIPKPDGTPYRENIRWRANDHLHRALVAIGDIIGWDHTCRRCKSRARKLAREEKTAARERGERRLRAKHMSGFGVDFTWRHLDGDQRECPTCGAKLWAGAIARPVRFYDLRHTHATLLRRARVDRAAVQLGLGHASADTTAIYDHSELEDHREAYERALRFERPAHERARPADGAHAGTLPPPARDDAPA